VYKDLHRWVKGVQEVLERVTAERRGRPLKKGGRIRFPLALFVLLRLVAQKLGWSSYRLHQRLTDRRQGAELRR